MSSRFKRRSDQAELMDDLSIVGAELDQTLAELRIVNRYLGGLSSTLAALTPQFKQNPHGSYRILDIGTGSADIPEGIVRWARKHHIQVEVVATDINPHTCAYARRCLADYPEVQVIVADVFDLPFPDKSFDFVHAAMFAHHFTQEQCTELVKCMYAKARCGVIINDLHRHPLAYYSIRFLTRLLSKSRLVRHDGPLSVLRAFRPPDIDAVKRRSGINLTYRWRWAFRWLITADRESDYVQARDL